MPTAQAAAAAASTGAEHVVDWIERELGGTVVTVERLPRWRAGWTVDVERDGTLLRLYARGERGADFPSPFALEHEEAVHDLLESHGLPVPHVHGVIDGPVRVLLMDRVAGQQGLALAASDDDRRRLLLDWVDQMAAMHRIPMEEVARRGILVPPEPADIVVSDVFQRVERRYLEAPVPRDPVTEFLRRWLRREAPRDRTRPAFVAWDAAQFLHDDGDITALIDFELAHVGDPYMDLAPLRTRDSMEPLGPLGPALARYAELTGAPIDLDLVRYFEISQLTVTLMLQWPVVCDPDPDSDYVTHLTWYVESGRYAIDVMGERAGWPVPDIAVPEGRRTRQAPAHAHLVRSLHRAARAETRTNLVRFGIDVSRESASVGNGAEPVPVQPADDFAGWRTRCDYRLARHLQRLDEIGDAVDAEDLADVAALLGRRVTDRDDADAALLAFVDAAGPEHDRALFDLSARRLQRWHLTLGPPGSLVVRHPALQPLSDPGQGNAGHR
jgi:aminoglycoside phosphotransferase (APT) family kinase protein